MMTLAQATRMVTTEEWSDIAPCSGYEADAVPTHAMDVDPADMDAGDDDEEPNGEEQSEEMQNM